MIFDINIQSKVIRNIAFIRESEGGELDFFFSFEVAVGKLEKAYQFLGRMLRCELEADSVLYPGATVHQEGSWKSTFVQRLQP